MIYIDFFFLKRTFTDWSQNHSLDIFCKSFSSLLTNCRQAIMCLFLRCGFHLTTLPYRPCWWRASEIVVLSLHRARLELCQSDHWILGHLHSAHLLPLLTLVWQPALGRILPDFFYSQMMATAVLSGSFSAAEISLLFPRIFS